MLPQWFREYLSFHRSERRGVIILIVILASLILFNVYQRFFWRTDWEEMKLQYGAAVIEFRTRQDSISRKRKEAKSPWLPTEINYFKFDPNTLDSAGWVSLGFSPKQAASIISYRNAGAVFRKPEDVKKLFVVDDEKYQALEPFIQIEDISKPKEQHQKPARFEKPKYQPIVVELNTADTSQLVKLYGIGPSFAKRIVKYRELLGGYVSKEQLLEVYGMDSTRYLPIEDRVVIDTTVRVRINVNTADVKELMRHPYLDRNQAKAIVNYRLQHGNYKQLSELRNIHLVTEHSYRKIAPYFTVQ